MSMLGWCIVHTIVRPVFTIFLTVLITIAADLASNPVVGSSIKTIDGFATNSTAMVNLFLCSVDKPSTPGRPINAPLREVSPTSSITWVVMAANVWENYQQVLDYFLIIQRCCIYKLLLITMYCRGLSWLLWVLSSIARIPSSNWA